MRRFPLLATASLAALARALNLIEVQRQDFVDTATGHRFEVIGVDYQPGGSAAFVENASTDVLSDPEACLRDAALMQRLGINTIRVYNLSPYLDHDACISIFNYVGIYMILDVNSPLAGDSIDQNSPASSYTLSYLERAFAIVDAFKDYPNLIGFFSANELIQPVNTFGMDPPYIRAVTRDLKQYIAANTDRKIPVGYSAADVREVLVDTSNYVQCTIEGEENDMSRSDFFALNSYSWCGADATFTSSTYDELAADFADTTIPVFFSEYGCFVPSPRVFHEVGALYGPKMLTWSGGLVYQWTEPDPPDDSGLVIVKADNSLELKIDYFNLQTEYSQLDFDLIQSRNATARSLTPPVCSPGLISGSGISKNFDIPAPPSGIEGLIAKGAGGRIGSLISVTKTEVQVVVTEVGGAKTTGLTITHVSSATKPVRPTIISGSTPAGSQPTGSSGSGSTDSAPPTPRSLRIGDFNVGPYCGVLITSFFLWLLS